MTQFLTHLESAIDGTVLPANRLQSMHQGRPLWVRYDLPAIRNAITTETFLARPLNMWRYRELLPVGDEIEPVSLDEAVSPIIACPRLANQYGLDQLLIKDEARLPQCSFKARGLSLAITMAKHFGVRRVAMSSNGNAGGSMASYAARAGMQSVVFVPRDTPKANLAEAALSGSKIYLADGLIDQCGKAIRQGHDRGLWFDISTLKEPYRLEGKKTMGLELAEQLGWELPDVIMFPTGGGTAVIGMWKAFSELVELGWLKSSKMPRMIVVQSSGCQPLVLAFEKGERFAVRYENATTKAAGLRVPIGIGDFMVLDAVQQSGGCVVAADDSKLFQWQRIVAQAEGMLFCPESAACIGALENLLADGRIRSDEQVVIFNTAAGQKYMDHLEIDVPSVDLEHFDWPGMERGLDGPAFLG